MSLSCLLWQLGDRIFLANASTCFNYTWTAVTRAVYKILHFFEPSNIMDTVYQSVVLAEQTAYQEGCPSIYQSINPSTTV